MKILSFKRKILLNALQDVKYGSLKLILPDGETLYFKGSEPGKKCDVEIYSWSVFSQVLKKSDIGLGETYMDGLWSTSSLPNFLTFLCQNQEALNPGFLSAPLFNMIQRVRNYLRKNSRSGSRKNISFHYDLGNEFYKLWLDSSMSYSSGMFVGQEGLENAQKRKLHSIISLLSPTPGSKILEIGCGWGSFLKLATQHGYIVEGITISTEQQAYCQKNISSPNAKIELLDYRDLKDKFDHIVSIEMFEAVGKEYWSQFFKKMKECLKPEGVSVIQTITIKEDFFKLYSRSSDFLRSYIFPGGFLPSPERFRSMVEAVGLSITHEIAFGDSYAKTLNAWLYNFNSAINKIKKWGYDDRFVRMWQFYLSSCIAGFATGRINVHQFKLVHK